MPPIFSAADSVSVFWVSVFSAVLFTVFVSLVVGATVFVVVFATVEPVFAAVFATVFVAVSVFFAALPEPPPEPPLEPPPEFAVTLLLVFTATPVVPFRASTNLQPFVDILCSLMPSRSTIALSPAAVLL